VGGIMPYFPGEDNLKREEKLSMDFRRDKFSYDSEKDKYEFPLGFRLKYVSKYEKSGKVFRKFKCYGE